MLSTHDGEQEPRLLACLFKFTVMVQL